ncbi:MAG TPA: DinB family protein [Gemmatimonadales bacterium]|nr:DinB family protein [Gemmatimonadales bacterium]
MNDREFFRSRVQAEAKGFRKVFEALPADRMEYRPHPKSPSAAEVMRTMAAELAACMDAVDHGRVEWEPAPPTSRDDMLARWDKAQADLASRLEGLDDAAWERPVQMSSGGKAYPPMPVGAFLWFLLFDAIHHRGQLTAYIRPMGGKVPGVYGRSADEKP